MTLNFKNNIFELLAKDHEQDTLTSPESRHIFFVSKWQEIIEQFSFARLYLIKSHEKDLEGWVDFPEIPDEKKSEEAKKGITLKCRANFFESALFYYNIIVDLSWVIVYVSAEFAIHNNEDEQINCEEIKNFSSIKDAIDSLRKLEKSVDNPHTKGNPYVYLKSVVPEFEEAINIIIEFWNYYSNSEIRGMYNFVKHRGKPSYTEINKLKGNYPIKIERKINADTSISLPSCVQDVQKEISLEEWIEKLLKFDNDQLLPYVNKLLESLKGVVDPSGVYSLNF